MLTFTINITESPKKYEIEQNMKTLSLPPSKIERNVMKKQTWKYSTHIKSKYSHHTKMLKFVKNNIPWFHSLHMLFYNPVNPNNQSNPTKLSNPHKKVSPNYLSHLLIHRQSTKPLSLNKHTSTPLFKKRSEQNNFQSTSPAPRSTFWSIPAKSHFVWTRNESPQIIPWIQHQR